MLFKASAPGSFMLMGEYAVLYGKTALVCAVDKRMHVTLSPRADRIIEIISDRYGSHEVAIENLEVKTPFQFITACFTRYAKKLPSGCTLSIHSEFSDQVGLGSSAALTVATLATLFAWFKLPVNAHQLIRYARQIIRDVQGLGSGADVAASVLGGVVLYRAAPFKAEILDFKPAITMLYSGSKLPTSEAIAKVERQFANSPILFKSLCADIHDCAEAGAAALQKQDWPGLGVAMSKQQEVMRSLGVSTPRLEDLLIELAKLPGHLGGKISGSGFGDCVIGLNAYEAQVKHADSLEVRIGNLGLEQSVEGL